MSTLPALALLLSLQYPPPPPEPVAEPPRRYGDQGTSHFGFSLGLGSGGGGLAWAGGLQYGYYVVDGLAPGLEAQVAGGTGLLTTGLTMGTLRFLPLRTSSFSVVLIGRGGRLFIEDHRDGWAVGGGAGVIFFMSAHVGLQVSYDVLRLLPSDFCADLSGRCTRQGLGLGLVFGF